ncbi:hypothetical protein [Roseburia inulinivorans]
MNKKIRKFLSQLHIKQFSALWIFIIVPVLALIINIVLSETQNIVGFSSVIIAIVFLVLLMAEITSISRKLTVRELKRVVLPRLELAIVQQPQEACNYDYLFEESIISDIKLSEFEKNCLCEEIWVVSNDLETEVDGGLYAVVVPHNLERGIKYKMFVPKNNLTTIRLEQLKRRNKNSENIEYYLLTDDFFFLVSKLDFTIYDPYKTSATGRRGYIGLDLPDCEELYAAKIDDSLVDAIASKLLEYIQEKKFEQG